MDNEIQILNIHIQGIKTQQIVKKVQEFLRTEPVSLVEVVTMDTLMQAQENSKLQEAIEQFDLVVPGEAEILKASGVNDENMQTELNNGTLWRNLSRTLEKKHTRIFLLADSEEQLSRIEILLQKHSHGIRVMGSAVLSKETLSDELIVNNINAAGVELVFGFLQTPVRERFAASNAPLMNARVWIGMDSKFLDENMEMSHPIRNFFLRVLFHRRVVQENRGKESSDIRTFANFDL